MGAKFYMCLLLVIMVTAPVYCARLRSAQDAEKSSLFLYGRLFQDLRRPHGTCCTSCTQCPYENPCDESYCFSPAEHGCPFGKRCCCDE